MASWWAPWSWFGAGQSHSDNFIRNLRDGEPTARPIVDEHTALQVSAVLCAMRVISEGVAQLPLKIFREEGEIGQVKRVLAKEHPAYTILHRRPNSWMTSFEWREMMTMHAVLLGSGFSIINRVNGRVDELIPVHPGHVQTMFDGSSVQYRISTVDGRSAVYDRGDVFHLRGPSMDGVTALPMIRLAADAIGLARSLEQSQTDLSSNGGRPSGILSFEGENLGPDARSKVASSWRESFGAGGRGGVAVLEQAWKYSALTMSAVDQQHIESRKMQIEEIGRVLRVLPIMMMHSDKAATYASAEQMFLAHIIHTLGPWVDRWEQAIDRDILNDDSVYSHFEVKGLMRGSAKERSEYFARALGTAVAPGWLTQNEVRGLEEVNPLPGGDVLFSPQLSTPVNQPPVVDEEEDANGA